VSLTTTKHKLRKLSFFLVTAHPSHIPPHLCATTSSPPNIPTMIFLFLIEFPIDSLPHVGSTEEQEYYTDILLGIKQVIQCHLKELQGRFQDKFVNLEMEVRRRDEIINQLQCRLRSFESGDGGDRMTPIKETDKDLSGSTGSSTELPFMVN